MGGGENRIFIGGFGWNTTERLLQEAFSRYGKILDCLVMTDRDTGRPRGFGFITFADRRAMEDAIRDMHGRELDGKIITVNRAEPKLGIEEPEYGYGGGRTSGDRDSYRGAVRTSGDRDSYRGADRLPQKADECFKCGRLGHWARECPSSGGGAYPSKSSHGSKGGYTRGDRYGGDRYDDRFDGDRYSDRGRLDSRDRYGGRGDRYSNDRYAPAPAAADSFGADRYLDRNPPSSNGYGRERGYDRDGSLRSSDRYAAGGPARFDRGGYKDRLGPYDRPRKTSYASSYDRY